MTDRQAQYRTRQRDKGLTQVAEWIPKTAVPAFKAMAAALRRGESVETPVAPQEPQPLNAKEETAVEREIKRRLRLLEAQMEERNKAQLEERVKMYSSEYARFRSFNESYRGVFSEEEYRLLLSVLHPDRCPPERASQFSRAFHLVKSKEEVLCGEKDSDSPETLPSSLAELMAQRRTKGMS